MFFFLLDSKNRPVTNKGGDLCIWYTYSSAEKARSFREVETYETYSIMWAEERRELRQV